MKNIKIGDKELGLKASPLALLYYKQEFETDLIADLATFENQMQSLETGDYSNFDSMSMLQMIYAMNKANNYGESFADFETWLADFDNINFADPSFFIDLFEEAREGFFRAGAGTEEQQEDRDG